MNELLRQALWLTVVGMGMTFAAIGTLVLGMYALTALTADKEEAASAEEQVERMETESPSQTQSDDDAYRAAAAAVAVAIAQAHTITRTRAERGTLSPWTSHVRREHVSQRANVRRSG
jgi:sodium pump decarboxylase gamma subunit